MHDGGGRPTGPLGRTAGRDGVPPGAPAGPTLGSTEGAPFAAVEIDVPAGSVLVFASDPLLTSYLAEFPGPLATVSEYADRPLQELGDALVYSLPADLGVSDAAVIVARTRAFPADRCAAWPLDPNRRPWPTPDAVRACNSPSGTWMTRPPTTSSSSSANSSPTPSGTADHRSNCDSSMTAP
ncbi:SpoIIE family protein phosphatase [Streptomyces sp. MS1.AVA.1]|uniref:SpoIIE family protein phosphatase n=1 Tax=Streptomyces machairae TaxID=3134109 RepID=A0ABU8UFK3_9ACTN